MTQERSYSLKELRARKGVYQPDVAKHIGVSVQTYSKWEKDLSNVGIARVYALADYFDVDIKEIKLK